MKLITFYVFLFVLMSSFSNQLRLKNKNRQNITNNQNKTIIYSKSQEEPSLYQVITTNIVKFGTSIKTGISTLFNLETRIENDTFSNIYNTLSITILLLISLGLIILLFILYSANKNH